MDLDRGTDQRAEPDQFVAGAGTQPDDGTLRSVTAQARWGEGLARAPVEVIDERKGCPRRNRSVGAEYCVTSCDQGVFMDQAAEPVPAQNAHPGRVAGWMCAPGGRVLLQRPVRPVDVVVVGVVAKD